MDTSDRQPPERSPAEPDINRLPKVVAIESALRTYREPRLRTRRSEVVSVDRAVEVTVETDGPIPERALGPVLVIGATEVTESERLGPTRYRFYAYDFEQLKPGSPIRLGWYRQTNQSRRTGFTFELPRD
jgi:hypothetical protein